MCSVVLFALRLAITDNRESGSTLVILMSIARDRVTLAWFFSFRDMRIETDASA